jgi:hypothetical protein
MSGKGLFDSSDDDDDEPAVPPPYMARPAAPPVAAAPVRFLLAYDFHLFDSQISIVLCRLRPATFLPR